MVADVTNPSAAPAYPDAPRLDLVDDFHGTPVPDPYRWLESADDLQADLAAALPALEPTGA